uniref:Retrovirus-related Pol polyprotein from transposon TNT 1-94 n=1 Tax=Tanacetum cinerariifolium TaxID=118510 RepID=A0A6L2JCM1_TANCI|nr:retrovirus-related Pol polyprotein from transposon TNT 1-94 [Tanacetum cinerariifolium]
MILEPRDPNREVPVNETFHVQTDDELTEKELKQIEADDQAIQTILLGLPEDEKKAKLFNEWERFTSNNGESIESYYHRFLKLMNDLKRNKHFPKKISSNLKFLNNLQPEWSRHVTIVHQKKDLHTADYTQLYDFLKYNQKAVDELKVKRLAKTQDPLALMETSNNPYNFPVPHQDQPSFNQNYMQQPIPNPEDITDPTTAMNMALALMAKSFKLNYSTTTKGFHQTHIIGRLLNRVIQNAAQNLRVQNIRNQNGLIGVLGNANQNLNGNGNLIAARAEGNATGHNGNQISCYNCKGMGHFARNCTMAAAADLDEIEEVNINCILMANLQQALTSGTQTDKAPVYDSDGSAEQAQKKQQSLYDGKVLHEKHDPPVVHDSEETLQLAQEKAAKFVRDFKSLAKEADESLAKHKALELEIERLLKAVVSDQKHNTRGTSANTKFAKQSIMGNLTKVGETHALSKPVTSNLILTPQESKVVKNDKVIALGMFRINPFKTSVEEKHVPNTVRASARTKPITVSQPHVFTKKYVNSDSNGLSSTRIDNTKTRRPQPRSNTKNDRVPSAESESQSDCSKGDNACTSNTLEPKIKWFPNSTSLLGRNDHVVVILGFGDLQWGNILIFRVYFVKGLGHNLFSLGQFCDSDLEVAFRRNACFVRNLEGVDLLKEDRSTNLYTISLHDMASASPICLMARASSTKSWLWHQRLSNLNFDTINDLAKNDLVSGLPKFKYHKEHLGPSCEQGKSKRASHPPKPISNSRQRLHLLQMDLCGPMRIASINGKRVYNRRTKKIMETMNVSFDELSAMAFEQRSELDLLFEAMYDDYIGGQPSAALRTILAFNVHQVRQAPMTSTSIADSAPTPTNSFSQAINFPNTSQDVDELNSQQQHAQQQRNQAHL